MSGASEAGSASGVTPQLIADTIAGINDGGLDVLEAVYLLADGRQCLYQELIDALGPKDLSGWPQASHLGALVALDLVDAHLPSDHAGNLRGYTIRDRATTAQALRERGRLRPTPSASYKRQRLSPLASESGRKRYPLTGGPTGGATG